MKFSEVATVSSCSMLKNVFGPDLIWVLLSTIGSRPRDHYFRSVFWFVCLSVCLFVCLCSVFLSRLWSD